MKAVFDTAIKVVLQPPKTKKQEGKHKTCWILWSNSLEERRLYNNIFHFFEMFSCDMISVDLFLFFLFALVRSASFLISKYVWVMCLLCLWLACTWFYTMESGKFLRNMLYFIHWSFLAWLCNMKMFVTFLTVTSNNSNQIWSRKTVLAIPSF